MGRSGAERIKDGSLSQMRAVSINGQGRSVDMARMDSTPSLAVGESRTSRKLHKNSQPAPSSISAESTASPTTRTEATSSTFSSRRRQSVVKENKTSSTVFGIQRTPSKRLAFGITPKPALNSAQKLTSSMRESSIPLARSSSINSSVGSNAGRKPRQNTTENSQNFLPFVNFDDLQSSIIVDATNSHPSMDQSENCQWQHHEPAAKGTDRIKTSLDMARTKYMDLPTIKQRPLEVDNLGGEITNDQIFSNSSNMFDAKDGNATLKAPRRKSYHPTNADHLSEKTLRKSTGTGISSDFDAGMAQLEPGRYMNELQSKPDVDSDTFPLSDSYRSPRSQKAKSIQLTPRKVRDTLVAPQSAEFELLTPQSSRSALLRTNTPSSSKRVSLMPNGSHATGLAARTISPTDARRMKRMSLMPHIPPLPMNLPPPQIETSLSSLAIGTSPANIPPPKRKSVTPSSSRTTPDFNRKSYSSGLSISSSTSVNSQGTSFPNTRNPQLANSSRLPTAKFKVDGAPTIEVERVPPVPAIPKAYESPKDETHFSLCARRKSSVTIEPLSPSSTIFGGYGDATPRKSSSSAHGTRTGQTMLEPATERRPHDLKGSRRNLQPLRLPPLNLLPLSAPTATKIAALYDGPTSHDEATTPPPVCDINWTPTTPMTASKANFSRSFMSNENRSMQALMRSHSSYHIDTSNDDRNTASNEAGHHIPSSATLPYDRATRTSFSPFLSSSLPKTSGEYMRSGREPTTKPENQAEPRKEKSQGTRLSKLPKNSREELSCADPPVLSDSHATSFGDSIRKRLSLSRRRSSSKPQSWDKDADAGPEPPAHGKMLPPSLPISVAPDDLGLNRSSSDHITDSKIASMSTIKMEKTPLNGYELSKTTKKPIKSSIVVREPKLRQGSATSQQTSVNPSKKGSKVLEPSRSKAQAHLDKVELAAEEEMRKLALKRKESEVASVELDALMSRALARAPITANLASKEIKLNIYERGEIVDYKDVYFCGAKNTKKHIGDLGQASTNYGYDDERGDYNIITGDHLAFRYEIIDILGKGSFGQVVRCIDYKKGLLVAIKIIRNKKRFHQQALVEVDILKKLREWDPQGLHGMVSFTQSFYFRGHLCISTELLGMNLYEFIKLHDFRGFSINLIRRFAKQLLISLLLLKSRKIIHCDLKPENILLAHPARSEIKMIDFGSSCHENEKVYTYIQSRFYRSPEVILGMTYGLPIDMWSLGCILAELLTGYPIFPGENEQEQLACIMEVFGPPEKHLIERSTRKKLFFDSLGKPRITVSTKGKRRRPSSKTLSQALKCENEAFLDFITRCLRWDPERRLKPEEAMEHEYITGRPVKSTTARPRTNGSAISGLTSPIKKLASLSHSSIPTNQRTLSESAAVPPAKPSVNTSSRLRNEAPNMNGNSSVQPSKTRTAQQQQQQLTQSRNSVALSNSYSHALPGATNHKKSMDSTLPASPALQAASISVNSQSRRASASRHIVRHSLNLDRYGPSIIGAAPPSPAIRSVAAGAEFAAAAAAMNHAGRPR